MRKGCHLTTRDGRRYLDLVAGLAVANVGHRHPQGGAGDQGTVRSLPARDPIR
jgi:acetylornithine/succinyldiaminopimelate/putrescine aminotransferase